MAPAHNLNFDAKHKPWGLIGVLSHASSEATALQYRQTNVCFKTLNSSMLSLCYCVEHLYVFHKSAAQFVKTIAAGLSKAGKVK